MSITVIVATFLLLLIGTLSWMLLARLRRTTTPPAAAAAGGATPAATALPSRMRRTLTTAGSFLTNLVDSSLIAGLAVAGFILLVLYLQYPTIFEAITARVGAGAIPLLLVAVVVIWIAGTRLTGIARVAAVAGILLVVVPWPWPWLWSALRSFGNSPSGGGRVVASAAALHTAAASPCDGRVVTGLRLTAGETRTINPGDYCHVDLKVQEGSIEIGSAGRGYRKVDPSGIGELEGFPIIEFRGVTAEATVNYALCPPKTRYRPNGCS